VTVEPLDPHTADPADLAACHAARAAHVATDLPGELVPTEQDTAASMTAVWVEEPRVFWVSRAAREVAGYSTLALPVRHNTEVGLLAAWVHPDQRRRGRGRALLAEAVRLLRDQGRDTVIMETAEGSPGAAFAERFGMAVGQREVLSSLDVSTVDPAWLGAHAATPHPPYRLQSWAGPVPDDVLDRYAAAMNGMRDAPVGDLKFEIGQRTGARQRDWEAYVDQLNHDLLVTVAVHEPSQEIAAVTVILLPRTPTGRALQDDTTVVRAHRGNGLGLWVKAAMAQRLLAEHPEIREVRTGNAEENVHMRRINTELGFRPARVAEERQVAVADLAKELGL
jgi:GNAT superfamily N-acetyltransferase